MYISPPLKSFVAVDKQIPFQIQATVNFPDALVVVLVVITSLSAVQLFSMLLYFL